MSLKSIIEIALHIETFRNIDLFHQGLYTLKFAVRTLQPSGITAVPQSCHTPSHSKNRQKTDPHNLFPAQIDERNNSFVCRRFLVRYCEEEVEMNDIGYFRLEVPYESEDYQLRVEVELLFSDLDGEITLEKAEQCCSTVEMKSVAKSTLIVQGDVHEFYPVVYEENYFSAVNLMIHTAILDFRYKSGGARSKLLSECLFPDKNKKPKTFVGAEETEKVYHKFMSCLFASFEKLRNALIEFQAKCLTPKEREDYGFNYIPPQLSQQEPSRNNSIDSLNSAFLGCIEDERPDISLSSISGFEEEKSKLVLRFSERVASHDPSRISKMVLFEVNMMAGHLFQVWYHLMELVKFAPKPLNTLLQEKFNEKIKEKLSEHVFRSLFSTKNFSLTTEENIGETHDLSAARRRQDRALRGSTILEVEEKGVFPNPEAHPILFEDIYIKEVTSSVPSFHPLSASTQDSLDFLDESGSFKLAPRIYRGIHLIVLVHGFQGNHFDMRLMKNNIAVVYPEALFLCSNSNEDSTEGDIGEMGVRLAQEVMNFISEWCPGKALGRLSFIGHSMGGLIIRAALPYLEYYSSKMHFYLTLSTPHLGYMYNSSKIIDAGMWFLKKWRKSKCLQQLSMSDSSNFQQTFMYELSLKKGLGWFKHVFLVSSYQDQYAPFDSARMELSEKVANDQLRGQIYIEMANSLLSGISAECLYRLDINFRISEKSLDSFIGRAAHIQFLENQTLMKMIIYRYPELFS